MKSHEELVDAVFVATTPTERSRSLLAVARWVSITLGCIQIFVAAPDLFREHAHAMHSGKHVAAFAIAIGVGLIYAGIRPHRASGLIPPLVALTVALLITCAVDIIHGRWPSELDIHFIAPIASGVLWMVAHIVRPHDVRGRRGWHRTRQ